MGGKPHAHVGHERRAPRSALLDDVEHVATGEHGEVRALADAVRQGGEQGTPEARERLLAGVAAAQLERGGAEPPATLSGQVHDVAVLLEGRQQVVDAGTGEPRVVAIV